MKRTALFLTIVLLPLFFSSCTVGTRGTLPYGVWKSEDPDLIIIIDPESEKERFAGTFVWDGEIRDVLIRFSGHSKEFWIFDVNDANENGNVSNYRDSYFDGTYRFNNKRLTYNVKPYWREKMGYENKTIVFEKIESYEIPEDKKADSFWAGFIKPPFTDVIIPAILILPVYLCPLFIKRKPRP